MKPKSGKFRKRAGYTIIELLTVMSIIVILMSLIVPALHQVRIFAKLVTQKNQFHDIDNAIEVFNTEQDGYPQSYNNTNDNYCGAMKLAEAMVGRDMLGFHPNSDLTVASSKLYTPDTMGARKMYLPNTHNVNWLKHIFSAAEPNALVLCDIYTETLPGGGKAGMPILYFKAETDALALYPAGSSQKSIYNLADNAPILALPDWEDNAHPMNGKEEIFFAAITNKKIEITTCPAGSAGYPYQPKHYILLSAGYDGRYGTEDDVYNFKRE